jgi:hypothetical protein
VTDQVGGGGGEEDFVDERDGRGKEIWGRLIERERASIGEVRGENNIYIYILYHR